MKAEIISIGTEIMIGSTLNTNSQFLSNKLIELGIESYYHSSVDDDEDRLTEIINIALERADLIITTGGLGPTRDDLTKEVVSKVLNLELETDQDMENNILNMFANMHINMTNNNKKQAMKPKGSEFILNDIGTAPGIFINKDNKKIIMLPGPPREVNLMFNKYVLPLLKEDEHIIIKSINTIGIGESSLESQILSLNLNEENIMINTYAKEGTIEIKIIGKARNKEEVENGINNIFNILKENLGDYIYGYDGISIEEVVFNLLLSKNMKIGLCESCTGGLIASKLTGIPGSSKVFDRGIVSYSNESKMQVLGVSIDTLNKYGAVSEQTAYEMAKGLMDSTDLDIVASITGIAGPDGGTDKKPVGLTYICIMTRKGHKTIQRNFNGNRKIIQNRASIAVLDEIRKTILK